MEILDTGKTGKVKAKDFEELVNRYFINN